MSEFKPGSIEHRKKVIEKYHIEDSQKIIDMSYDKFESFCTGLEIGEKYGGLKATYSVLKNPNPQQVIDMMYSLSKEDRDKVLDEFCEPIRKENPDNSNVEVEPEDTLDIEPQQYCDNCEYRNLGEDEPPCCDCIDWNYWESITGNEEKEEDPKA